MRLFLFLFVFFTLKLSAQVRIVGDTVIYDPNGNYYTVKPNPDLSNKIVVKEFSANGKLTLSSEFLSSKRKIVASEIAKLESENILQKDGLLIKYDSLGLKKEEQKFENGALVSLITYNENGKIETKSKIIKVFSRVTDYYQNDTIIYRFHLKTLSSLPNLPPEYSYLKKEYLDGDFLAFDKAGNVQRSILFSKNIIVKDTCYSYPYCPNFIDSLQVKYPGKDAISEIQPSEQFLNKPVVSIINIEPDGTTNRKVESQRFYNSLKDSILLYNWINAIEITPEKFMGKTLKCKFIIKTYLGSFAHFTLIRDSRRNILKPEYTLANHENRYTTVEKMPEFSGGTQAMYEFLYRNLIYPEQAAAKQISGRVYVRFVIDHEGFINDPEITQSLSPECDAEAVRVVLKMPRWIPGYQNGKPVSTYYILPINFTISK